MEYASEIVSTIQWDNQCLDTGLPAHFLSKHTNSCLCDCRNGRVCSIYVRNALTGQREELSSPVPEQEGSGRKASSSITRFIIPGLRTLGRNDEFG